MGHHTVILFITLLSFAPSLFSLTRAEVISYDCELSTVDYLDLSTTENKHFKKEYEDEKPHIQFEVSPDGYVGLMLRTVVRNNIRQSLYTLAPYRDMMRRNGDVFTASSHGEKTSAYHLRKGEFTTNYTTSSLGKDNFHMTSVSSYESDIASVSTFSIQKDYNNHYYTVYKTGQSDRNYTDGFTSRCPISDENWQRTLKVLKKAFLFND